MTLDALDDGRLAKTIVETYLRTLLICDLLIYGRTPVCWLGRLETDRTMQIRNAQ